MGLATALWSEHIGKLLGIKNKVSKQIILCHLYIFCQLEKWWYCSLHCEK
jgi:hypothetical protein